MNRRNLKAYSLIVVFIFTIKGWDTMTDYVATQASENFQSQPITDPDLSDSKPATPRKTLKASIKSSVLTIRKSKPAFYDLIADPEDLENSDLSLLPENGHN